MTEKIKDGLHTEWYENGQKEFSKMMNFMDLVKSGMRMDRRNLKELTRTVP